MEVMLQMDISTVQKKRRIFWHFTDYHVSSVDN